jgi:hypothetical protein
LDSPETPTNASVISDITAKITVPTKLDAITAVRFGMISKKMSRHVDSPVARAASTYSRPRKESVCALSTRAPHAHDVKPMITATRKSPPVGTALPTMMISGSAGITRNTLDSAESPSPGVPPR